MLLSETGHLASQGDDVVLSKKESVSFSSLDQTSNESYDLLHRLVRLFPSDDGRTLERSFRLTSGLDLSPPFDTLLFHEEHLTGVMERRHGGVSVKVLTSRCLSDSLYCRRILLQAPCGKYVTYAVLLANLDNLPDAVRAGVREEKVPFGRFGRAGKLQRPSSHFTLVVLLGMIQPCCAGCSWTTCSSDASA